MNVEPQSRDILMRLFLLFVFSALLVACPEPEDFTLSIVNDSGEIRYQDGPIVGLRTLEMERSGEWEFIRSNGAFLCLRTCGEAGPVECAMGDAPFFPPQVHALLPGDSLDETRSGSGWIVTADLFGECAQKIALEGLLRTTVCHSAEAIFVSDESPVDPPAESGLVGDGSEETTIQDPTCETFEFELPAEENIVELVLTDDVSA